MRDRGHKLKQGVFRLDKTESGETDCKDNQGGGQAAQRGCAVSFPGGFQGPAGKILSNLV